VKQVIVPGEVNWMTAGKGISHSERFIWWNFVSSRKDRIEQAKADWKDTVAANRPRRIYTLAGGKIKACCKPAPSCAFIKYSSNNHG